MYWVTHGNNTYTGTILLYTRIYWVTHGKNTYTGTILLYTRIYWVTHGKNTYTGTILLYTSIYWVTHGLHTYTGWLTRSVHATLTSIIGLDPSSFPAFLWLISWGLYVESMDTKMSGQDDLITQQTYVHQGDEPPRRHQSSCIT